MWSCSTWERPSLGKRSPRAISRRSISARSPSTPTQKHVVACAQLVELHPPRSVLHHVLDKDVVPGGGQGRDAAVEAIEETGTHLPEPVERSLRVPSCRQQTGLDQLVTADEEERRPAGLARGERGWTCRNWMPRKDDHESSGRRRRVDVHQSDCRAGGRRSLFCGPGTGPATRCAVTSAHTRCRARSPSSTTCRGPPPARSCDDRGCSRCSGTLLRR